MPSGSSSGFERTSGAVGSPGEARTSAADRSRIPGATGTRHTFEAASFVEAANNK